MKVFDKWEHEKVNQYLPQLILLLGVFLRLKIYFENRSLFIDEGALTCEIVGKSFAQFFQPLDYQFSPPFYSVLVKMSTLVLGNNEYGLRLISLIAGISSLFIFYKFLQKQLKGIALFYPLGLMVFGIPFLQYSTECKQYGVDVLATTILLYLFFKHLKELDQLRFYIGATIIGIAVIWFSMPSVFVLAGLGGYVFLQGVVAKDKKLILRSSFMIGTWLISFAIYYFTILAKDAEIGSLINYHQAYFFPLLPTSSAELLQALDLLLNILKSGVGATAIALIPAFVFLLAGIYDFWKKEKLLCLALCLPGLLCVLTSGLGLYSLIGRMTLFLMPLIFLFLGKGMSLVMEKIGGRFSIFFWTIVIISWINLKSIQFFYQPYQIEEIRPVLEYVHEHQQKNESAFVHHLGMTSFRFYQNYHQNKDRYHLLRVKEMVWSESLKILAKKQALPCWVIITHLTPEEREAVLQQFRKVGKVVDSFQAKNAGAWLFSKEH